jgi:hypothetical protein
MTRPFLVILFLALPAWAWAQDPAPQQPVPDTKPARERHRIAEKLPPPPEGPWGPEEFGFVWHNPVWRGFIVNAGNYAGASLNLNVPNGLAASSDGINPPVFEELEWGEENFNTTSISIAADLDMFRLSASYFSGTFDARGTFTHDDGVTKTSTDVDFNGDIYGFRLGIHWPMLRYRDDLFEASIGPIATVGWIHEETSHIPGGVLLTRDGKDVLSGSFGPKASARMLFNSFEVELNAEYSFLTGAVRGWSREFSAGIGLRF